jgi:hypothetical protein
VQAVETNGKAGVVWHTQGSGKSMEMELYTNLVSRHPKLKNPTVIVVTDRTELDGQLFQTFDQSLLLAEKPVQVRERAQLRDELRNRSPAASTSRRCRSSGSPRQRKASGTQHPLLTDRRNVIVVVDEAHRSHYDDLDGYARHLRDALPNATLIAFTGTPISFAERDTRAVFGDYIDIYDLRGRSTTARPCPSTSSRGSSRCRSPTVRARTTSIVPPTNTPSGWTTPSGRGSRHPSPSSTPSTARRSASRRSPPTSCGTGRSGASG